MKKPTMVIPADSLNDLVTSDILRSVPLSNRIKTRTRLLNSEPIVPNFAESTSPVTGPSKIPININPKTSGIPRRSKTPAR